MDLGTSFYRILPPLHFETEEVVVLHNFLSDRQRDMDAILLQQVDSAMSATLAEIQEPSMINPVQSSNIQMGG